MIYDALVDLVGTVPSGLSDFVYIISCAVAIVLVLSAFSFLGSLFKSLSQR